MQILLSRTRNGLSFLGRFLNHDFCPNANRYVYWLKQPIGWFVLAIAASLLVSLYANSQAWPVAIALIAIVIVGLVFPWLAVRCCSVSIRPLVSEVHEWNETSLVLRVRNRLPIPIWGFFIEGFLAKPLPPTSLSNADREIDFALEDAGLACVPPLSHASYHLPVAPEFRGRYPKGKVFVTCAFPFGIWKARREVIDVRPLVVRPATFDVACEAEWRGRKLSAMGVGRKAGGHGEYLGVRPFRRGDGLKSIHWAHTARTGEFVVCERSQPREETVVVSLSSAPSSGNALEVRRNYAWRVRIAATLCRLLTEKRTSFQLKLASGALPSISSTSVGSHTYRQAVDLLTELPLDPIEEVLSQTALQTIDARPNGQSRFEISSFARDHSALGAAHVRLTYFAGRTKKDSAAAITCVLDLQENVASQLESFLQGALDGQKVA